MEKSKRTRICPGCNKRVRTELTFCPNCGVNLHVPRSAVQCKRQPNTKGATAKGAKQSSSSSCGCLALAGLMLAGAVILVVVLLLSDHDGEMVREISGEPVLPPGTQVELVDTSGAGSIPGIAVWYMYEDRCEIDVAHDFVPSGTRASIVGSYVCYAQDYDSSHRSYYYKVRIPDLDYQTTNNWVNARFVVP